MTSGADGMGQRWRRVEELFDDAVDLEASERRAYLDGQCAGDAELRAEVETLLRAADAAGPLDLALGEAVPEIVSGAVEPRSTGVAVPERVGDWRILQEVGSGGMGRVFLAERVGGDFEQQVALKTLRWELASERWTDRFLAERRILASLEHPNIARLVDGGVSDEGLPFLAMEYVSGETIDVHCEAKGLSIGARLQLFLEVCGAVQHAHAQLVVHRDLKPSNILVDGEGRVKLLDFGVAKIVDETVEPGLTQTELAPASPAYAAPEQLLGGTITTQTDVWALGVLLFELLTGARPFEGSDRERQRFEPPSRRRADEWGRRLRGDLDTIVEKALRPEADERYASVERFADDVVRYLGGRPVSARPATWGYRARKFIRRHRPQVAAATLAVATLVGVSGLYTHRISQARDRAEQEAAKAERVSDLLVQIFQGNDPRQGLRGDMTVREVLDRGVERLDAELVDQPDLLGDLLLIVGGLYRELGLYDQALSFVDRSAAVRSEAFGVDSVERARALVEVAIHHNEVGDPERAREAIDETLAVFEAVGVEGGELANALDVAGYAEGSVGEYAAAQILHRRALEELRQTSGEETEDYANSLSNLALAMKWGGDADGAEPLYREALAIRRRVHGPKSVAIATTLDNLGVLLGQRGDYAESEELFLEALDIRQRVLDEEHPDVGLSFNNLSKLFLVQGRLEEAEPFLRQALAVNEALFGPDHPRVATNLSNLGDLLLEKRESAEALSLQQRALDLRREALGPDHIEIALNLHKLGLIELRSGDPSAALAYYEEAVPMARRTVSEESFQLGLIVLGEASVRVALGQVKVATERVEVARAVLEAALSPDHWANQFARGLAGWCAARAGDLEGAERLDEASRSLAASRGEADGYVVFLAALSRDWTLERTP